MPHSVATVATTASARYAKQLASHLGRRAEVLAEPTGDRIVLAGGSCLLEAGTDRLVLRATAGDEAALRRVEQVIGSHLERFGARSELTVAWQPAA
jgi:hypothetical protein